MKIKIKFKDYDLQNYLKGIELSDVPLTEKEVEISKKYIFISKINEFSIKSNQVIVKKDSKLTIN